MLNQSFRQVFVTNSPALLAQGSTVENLGVGQVGILDANTYKAVTAPTYATTKAIKLVQGTPDLSYLPMMAGVPNENEYSKLIKGKKIVGFRGKKAKRGRNQVITIGWSGDSADTDTLFARPGDQKFLYVKLTGPAIDILYSTQGIIRQYAVDGGCIDDCTDTCAVISDPRTLAESVAKQINTDSAINKFVKATVISECTPALDAPDTVDCYQFEVAVCDTRDDVATGIVQSQYPDFKVTRARTEGSLSVYTVTKDTNTLPAAVSNAGFILIPDCPTCPAGYTLSDNKFAYKVTRSDAGDAGALTTLNTDYGVVSPETTSRLGYEFGQSTYVVLSDTKLDTPTAGDGFEFLGETRNTCVITTPTTTAWTLTNTLKKYPKTYRVTVADSLCGTNRLTDIQAAYPDNVVTIVDASGDCVHTYETTQYSQCVPDGCSADVLKFTAPEPFEGAKWVEVPTAALPDGTVCKTGVRIDVAFVNRLTGECTYDYFPYEGDTIHVEASTFDPNYNNAPDACTNQWSVKEIQSFEYPAGFGAYIRKLEQTSKSYDLRERSFDPVVREVEGYQFQAVPNKYYDEYIIDYEFEYKVGGWSEKYVDSYSQSVFFPEGQGKAFETAINGYVTSVGIQLEPVVL